MNYESYIDQIIADNQIRLDDVLLDEDENCITIEDFVRKTKIMSPWHRKLLEDFTEIQEAHGDIVEYMRKYTKDKLDNGFRFTM